MGEASWRAMSYEQKENLAKTIGCAAVGPGKLIPLTFRSDLSNQVVGEFGPTGLKIR